VLLNSFSQDFYKALVANDLNARTDAKQIVDLNVAAWEVFSNPLQEFRRQGVIIDTDIRKEQGS
jgi:hypothetical protein